MLEEEKAANREAVTMLVNWCDSNFLDLNISKTKELTVDYRRKKDTSEPLVIKGDVDSCCKRANQRLRFLWKLRSFGVNKNVVFLFYQFVV